MKTSFNALALAVVPLLNGPALAAVVAEGAAPPAAESTQSASRPSERSSFEFTAGLGVKHDSNVAVLELDANSGESDYAALLDLGLGYKFALTDAATVRVDYGFSHTEYQDYTEFNLGIHRGSLDFAYDFKAIDTGVTFHYIDALLDSEGFLTMKQVSPYVSKLFGKRLFLRAAYTYADKEFDGNPARDASNDAYSADAFVFLNGLKTYLVFSYKLSMEEAEDVQFDYRGDQVSAQITHKVPLLGSDLQLRSRVRYESRDYDEITPSIGEKRDDERYRYDVSMAVPLGSKLTATAAYEYTDNQSNLTSVDFAEKVWSLRLDAKL